MSCVDSRSAKSQGEHIEMLIRTAMKDQENLQTLKIFPLQAAFPARLYGKSRFQILLKSQDEAALSYILRLVRQIRSSPEISLSLSLDPA